MSRRVHPAVVPAQPFHLATREAGDGPVLTTDEGREWVETAVSRYPQKKAALLPLLNYVQSKRGWVTPGDMADAADALDLTPAFVHSVATFYTMYNRRPVGRHLIQVCTNIACFLNRGEEVLERFLEETGTHEGEMSACGNFTVLEQECLGACGFATVVHVNEKCFENVTPEGVGAIVQALRDDAAAYPNGAARAVEGGD